MNEQFVPYEIALKLKEKGFDDKCIAYYTADTHQLSLVHGYGELMFADYVYLGNVVKCVPCPLYQQVFQWFREKHGIVCTIILGQNPQNYYPEFSILKEHKTFSHKHDMKMWFDSYEKTELACINKMLELI
jgi:hypothetical protein